MRRLVVRGVNCTQMENLAAAATQYPEDTVVGEFLREKLGVMLEANRKYLRKRGTQRLLELLGNSFWKAPLRSAPSMALAPTWIRALSVGGLSANAIAVSSNSTQQKENDCVQ